MAQGGPSGAMEMFLRWADGDEVYESLDPDFRDRMLGDGEVLFGLEMEPVLSYHAHVRPARVRSRCPAPSSRARENRDPAATHHWAYEASQWTAEALDAPLVEMPGAHGSMITHPEAFVTTCARSWVASPPRHGRRPDPIRSTGCTSCEG